MGLGTRYVLRDKRPILTWRRTLSQYQNTVSKTGQSLVLGSKDRFDASSTPAPAPSTS